MRVHGTGKTRSLATKMQIVRHVESITHTVQVCNEATQVSEYACHTEV